MGGGNMNKKSESTNSTPAPTKAPVTTPKPTAEQTKEPVSTPVATKKPTATKTPLEQIEDEDKDDVVEDDGVISLD